jgi:methylglutaconyl-CoA hydratase
MSELIYEVEEGTAWLTLNRPEKRNALNDALIGSLKDALRKADGDESLYAVVVRGAGKDFCSGADLSALQKISENSREENLADARNLMELYLLVRQVKLPVIAAVHGRALAGGCGLATACDIVLATQSARFGYPEVKIGFVPAMVTAILRRNLGEKKSFEILTRGFEFSAGEAERIGLVNRVFPEDNFETSVREYVSVYKSVSRSAVALTKKLLYEIDGTDIHSAMEKGAEINAIARETEDCKKGIARFLNKS